MVKPAKTCAPSQTIRERRWHYEQYYIGEEDDEGRKNGQGENHWTGAESLEWYTGPMLHDTMHGDGDYRWRYKDPDGSFVTYEGRFFANQMHGYGMMSYTDGRVFTGLFYKDIRWGPGVERHFRKSNVGCWRGSQLARLSWRPPGPTVAPNLALNAHYNLDSYRVVLWKNIKIVGETNTALDLLKWYGANPVEAIKKWEKLYPRYCTDVNSELFNKDLFDYKYYGKKIHYLSEKQEKTIADDESKKSDEMEQDKALSYLAWNNNEMIIHMMKHCYMHETQRAKIRLNLHEVMSGLRKKFKPPSTHEVYSRCLLLASFNGDISDVTQLVNEKDIYPDVADSQGNTALMYATCGDQKDVMHFLVEAGATVNSYNDSCCTPLGVALLRFLCVANDIPRNEMLSAILPPKPEKFNLGRNAADEWQMTRETTLDTNTAPQSDSKAASVSRMKVNKSKQSVAQSMVRMKSQLNQPSQQNERAGTKPHKDENEGDSDEDPIFSDEKKLFLRVNEKYRTKLAEEFTPLLKESHASTHYLFTVCDVVKDIDASLEDLNALPIEKANFNKLDKKSSRKSASKTRVLTMSDVNQVSEEIELDESYQNVKLKILLKIDLTIKQLLADGADPTLVKCPQPAILLAVTSGCLDLVKHMVSYGVNIDEKFPEFHDYTVLDIVISDELSNDNLAMISTLLELGADTCHRLKIPEAPDGSHPSSPEPIQAAPVWTEGPTLLHAVVLKKQCQYEFEEEIRREEIRLLLQHNADPTAQYKGQSPIDCAMSKNLTLLSPFIQHPGTNLNAIINQRHHTILVKLFSREYFKKILSIDKTYILTNLLLYGADPLIECYDEDVRYENLFDFAQYTLRDMLLSPRADKRGSVFQQRSNAKFAESSKNLMDKKKASKTKIMKDSRDKIASKWKLPPASEEARRKNSERDVYKDTLTLAQDCTRLLYIRWLQGKLLKELVDVIARFKHRHWTMIIKEHNIKNAHNVGIWVTSARCLEVWDILKTSHKPKYKDENIRKKLLQIVQFYHRRIQKHLEITPTMTAAEKNEVEKEVELMIRDHKIGHILATEAKAWKRPYVKPELFRESPNKFNICFECCLPKLCLPQEVERIVCEFCGLVSFCNLGCLITNLEKINGHPCSKKLKQKFPLPEDDNSSSIYR
ncbi:hypothetical protein NE865_02997 [Phthorimaea operculella]|nr:hypothetical protein NE865_02997 [Phthorimaea operculella]